MKKYYNRTNSFVLRTPILPISFATNLPDEEALLFEYIKKIYSKPLIRESLFLSSPELYNRFIDWTTGNGLDTNKQTEICISLLKYLLRMSTRCTPFGLNSGVNVGYWHNKPNSIVLNQIDQHFKHVRLDMYYIVKIIEILEDKLKSMLKYYPNDTIYELGDQLRFFERTKNEEAIKYNISSVSSSNYLTKILRKASNGENIEVLATSIMDDEISRPEAIEFLEELIDAQILVSELQPTVTGEDNLSKIMDFLESNYTEISESDLKLGQIVSIVELIKSFGLKRGIEKANYYEELVKTLESLELKVDRKKLVQVDLEKKVTSCKLNNEITSSVRKGLEAINRLSVKSIKSENLESFKSSFVTRYENSEIPLLQALDTETGIGYLQRNEQSYDISPIIDSIPIGTRTSGTTRKVPWSKQQSLLLQKYIEATKEDQYEIEILDSDIQKLPNDWLQMPDSFYAMGEVYDYIENLEFDNKPIIYLTSASGSSAINLVGRFSYINEEFFNYSKNIANVEQEMDSNKVIAEISHLPGDRIGNVLHRSFQRQYEIPFLASSSIDREKQIPLHDIMISVRESKIILRSKKLNKEIIPRLSNAHNYRSNSLPAYHFLCDLQFQSTISHLNINWGVIEREFIFLPRIRYQNIILKKASWRFHKRDIHQGEKSRRITSDLFKVFRTKVKIPQFICLKEGDNELFLDLDNALCIKILLSKINKGSNIQLIEFLFDGNNSPVLDGNKQNYTNQIVFGFTRKQKKASQPISQIAAKTEVNNLQRKFIAGQKWFYLKLYMGVKSADDFLIEILLPIVQELYNKKKISKFFFIRYSEDGFHLRLRFELVDPSMYNEVLKIFNNKIEILVKNEIINRVHIDTYIREVERYQEILIAENFFSIDSIHTLNILSILKKSADEELLKLFVGLKSIDSYLNNFGFTLNEKKAIVKSFKKGFRAEFNATKTTTKKIGEFFKKVKNYFPDLSINKIQDSNLHEEWSYLMKIISIRDREIKLLLENYRKSLEQDFPSSKKYEQLIWAYMHVSSNRLYRSKARKYELLLYSVLHKIYQFQERNASLRKKP